jgi:flagellar biosynthesis protein FliQ
MQVALIVSLPILAVTLFLGLLVSVFQAITQVQEQTLTFVPKLIGVGLVLTFMGGWMLNMLVKFATLCLERIAMVGH